MIKNFFSARLLVAALCVIVGIETTAQVIDSTASLPNCITGSGNTLLWLDASDSSTYDVNANRKVTVWRSKADPSVVAFPTADSRADNLNNNGFKTNFGNYIDKTDIGDAGTIGITNNVSAFLMGSIASGVDMSFNRLTTIRTVFWVMDIMQNGNAFFLGDNNDYDFHRNSLNYNNGQGAIGFAETSIWCDGVLVENKTGTPVPAGLHVYSMVAQQNFRACHLSLDRNTTDGNGQNGSRHGGKALSELIIFDVPLSDTMVKRVESYLQAKWMGDGDPDPIVSLDKTEITVSELNAQADPVRPQIVELLADGRVTLKVDAEIKASKLAILPKASVKIVADGGNVGEFFAKAEFGLEGNKYAVTDLTGSITISENGALGMGEDDIVTLEVGYGQVCTIKGVVGGKLIKTGDGDLRLEKNGEYAINGTTIEIQAGLVTFNKEGSAVMNDPTFILHEGTKLDNYGWPTVTGTLTLESDVDVTIFTNTGNGSTGSQNSAQFQGNPSIVKKGKGKINLMCGASNDTAHNNVITSVQIENGTLSFGGSAAKFINAVSGEGALEQSGAGTMTILKVAPETSLKVASGALNNECAAGNGSLNLAGLEIAAGATYTMKSAIDHLNISKSFYLEGDAHKNWYVTLGDGALIATNPENPMTLAGLEFGKSVKIGNGQSVGSVLAKVVKPLNMPELVTSADERFAKIPYTLKYQAGSIMIARTFTAELETIPGKDLNTAKYRIKVTELPKGMESGDIRVRITTPYSSALANVKRSGDEWYAELNPAVMNEAKGEAYQIKVEIGVNDNNKFVPIESYGEISLNVRPEVKNGVWIDEASHDRWRTGKWDTEGEYITISEGYVQVEGEKVSFVPDNINKEAATKLHFEVKFGEAMKLEILNALSDEEMLAGVALEEAEDGLIGYAAWNPTSKEYVSVISSDKKPIDISASHLVEVTLAKNGIAYSIDGAALVTKDGKASSIFALPKSTSIQIAEIDFEGMGAVKSMTADEYSTKLAAYDGVEYDTIEKAIIAAGDASRVEIEQLWDASWVPTPDLKDKVIVFTGGHKVSPDTTSGVLAENDMVLRPNTDGSYSVISKFLIVSIPDTETMGDKFGIFLESVTTNSMHLGWAYDYNSDTPTLAKATVVYDDDVTINFSTTLENNGLMVQREDTSKSFDLKGVTFTKVHYDFAVAPKYIPVIDQAPVASQKTLAKFGVAKQDVARAESAGILDFTTAADGVTFTVGLLDAEGNDITKIISEQIGEMVYFAEKLGDEWKPVGAENVKVITNDDGVQVMFAQQEGATSGFYKVVIPAE